MRVATSVITVVAVALLAAAPAPARTLTGVRLVECKPAERAVTFEGSVRRARGASWLQMRFTLQTRATEEDSWRPLAAPGFDTWVTSGRKARRHVHAKGAAGLAAPAAYRVAVAFRWLNAAGHVIDRDRVLSAPCELPDVRPNLRPQSLEVAPVARRGLARYLVAVRNEGPSAAGAFELALTVNGQLLPQLLPSLAAGEVRTLTVRAPRCEPGGMVGARADSRGQVDERDELDNELSTRCPAQD